MTYLFAALCALPLALSHDLGGPLGLVALAPIMALSRRVDNPFAHGFICGFVEVAATMWGASSYTLLIPATLGIQAGLARGCLAWAIAKQRGPILPVSVLVLGQGLRATSVLTLPLSCGHDLAAVPWLGWPAAFGGGALLTALCGLTAYALSHPKSRRAVALYLGVLIIVSGLHEALRPRQGPAIELRASIVQGGLPNWVYRQASVDPKADALIRSRYLDVAANEPLDRLVILPETAVRDRWGSGSMTAAFRAMHERGLNLVAGVNHHFDGALRNSAMVWLAGVSEPVFQTKQTVVPVVERDFEAMADQLAELPQGGRVQICIESVYPRYSDPKASWLLVLTNDAGVGRSAPRRAFERESRLRAIETGRSLLRAGQDGLSYALSPHGQIIAAIEPYRAGVLRIEKIPGPVWSLRGAVGDWVFWLCWPIAGWAWFSRSSGREETSSAL